MLWCFIFFFFFFFHARFNISPICWTLRKSPKELEISWRHLSQREKCDFFVAHLRQNRPFNSDYTATPADSALIPVTWTRLAPGSRSWSSSGAFSSSLQFWLPASWQSVPQCEDHAEVLQIRQWRDETLRLEVLGNAAALQGEVSWW